MANSNFYARPSVNVFEVRSKKFARPFNDTVTRRYQSREDGCGQWSRDILTITQSLETEKPWMLSGHKSAMHGCAPCADGARKVEI